MAPLWAYRDLLDLRLRQHSGYPRGCHDHQERNDDHDRTVPVLRIKLGQDEATRQGKQGREVAAAGPLPHKQPEGEGNDEKRCGHGAEKQRTDEKSTGHRNRRAASTPCRQDRPARDVSDESDHDQVVRISRSGLEYECAAQDEGNRAEIAGPIAAPAQRKQGARLPPADACRHALSPAGRRGRLRR